jgi:predicted helicase
MAFQEANEANEIKKDTPVMCVIGNPPYAVSSTNKGPWIQNLIGDYKKDLNERKINLDDDYIKFIRYGQHYIDKNGEGILAYISANSFIDGVTHRQMRKHLLESFDKVYILDLHGNAKKKEVAPDGSIDQNVFDIMAGVSINIFVKTGKKKKNEVGKVYHFDSFGKREVKYNFLNDNSLKTINWNLLQINEPYYFFSPKNLSDKSSYDLGFDLGLFFVEKNTGIQTKNDSLTLQFNLESIKEIEKNFLEKDVEELKELYGIKEGTWKISDAKADLLINKHKVSDILVKPFDKRYTIFNSISGGFLGRPRYNTMKNMLAGKNIALLLGRQNKSQTIDSFFVTDTLSEMKCAERTIQSYHFPLYIYKDLSNQQSLLESSERVPNLNMEIVNKIADHLSCEFIPDDNIAVEFNAIDFVQPLSPLNILDYIYAVLHSPKYRETYKEF